MGRSLVQRTHTESCVSECDLKTSTMRTLRPTSAVELLKKEKVQLLLCIKLKTETSCSGITHFV